MDTVLAVELGLADGFEFVSVQAMVLSEYQLELFSRYRFYTLSVFSRRFERYSFNQLRIHQDYIHLKKKEIHHVKKFLSQKRN